MNAVSKSAAGAREVQQRYVEALREWPVANEQLRVPTREGETFIIASGASDAPPLVLPHGTGINSIMWMGDIAEMSKHHRVYAVDLIGEPGLSAPSRPPLDSDAYALWLDDVMDALDLPRAALVGASLGGWLAVDYATRRPRRAARLVLLCPGGIGRQRYGFVFTALLMMMFGSRGRYKALRILLGVDLRKGDPDFQQFGQFMTLILKHFRGRTEKLPIFSEESLRKLEMPVLAIIGGRDAIFDSADTKRRLQACVPHAEIRYLPDAGHGLLKQSDAVLDFLHRTADAV